jgi:hypothetical protein
LRRWRNQPRRAPAPYSWRISFCLCSRGAYRSSSPVSTQPDTWFKSAAASWRLQLASLPLHVSAVIRSSHELNESDGFKFTACWQYCANAAGWFFQ